MTEVIRSLFTVVTSLRNLWLQGFELALHGRWRSTADQPELRRQWRCGQTFLQIVGITPGNGVRRDPTHGNFHLIAEIEQASPRAITLAEATGALADQTELILFTHSPQSRIQFGKAGPPPTGQQQTQHDQTTAASRRKSP